jgi:tRNA-dihydrouridine synthase
MREPDHAAEVIAAMTKAVSIPVTVKMRAGWDERSVNAPELARRAEEAGAAAVAVHGRTAAQSYSGVSDWDLISRVADALSIPVFGSGDCVEARQILERLGAGRVSGVLVGRGVLRNPWILAQARDLSEGREPIAVTAEHRRQFLLEYMDLLLHERLDEAAGFRHRAPGDTAEPTPARGRERWVINKLRALVSWYSKGLESGGQLRVAINSAQSIAETRDIIDQFFSTPVPVS